MLFGSIDNIFGVVQGSVEAFGGSLGGIVGEGSGSALGLVARLIETIYSASGQPIEPPAL